MYIILYILKQENYFKKDFNKFKFIWNALNTS